MNSENKNCYISEYSALSSKFGVKAVNFPEFWVNFQHLCCGLRPLQSKFRNERVPDLQVLEGSG